MAAFEGIGGGDRHALPRYQTPPANFATEPHHGIPELCAAGVEAGPEEGTGGEAGPVDVLGNGLSGLEVWPDGGPLSPFSCSGLVAPWRKSETFSRRAVDSLAPDTRKISKWRGRGRRERSCRSAARRASGRGGGHSPRLLPRIVELAGNELRVRRIGNPYGQTGAWPRRQVYPSM